MKFGQLILRKIIRIVGNRCQILRLKFTKIHFGWGSAPDFSGGLTPLPRSPSWNKGDLLLREGKGRRDGKVRKGRGRQGNKERKMEVREG